MKNQTSSQYLRQKSQCCIQIFYYRHKADTDKHNNR